MPSRRDGRSKRSGTCRPFCDLLESRDLTVVSSVTGIAMPNVLQPPGNRWVTVSVKGTVNNTLKVQPQVNYQVIDDYRVVQPVGNVKLTRFYSKPGDHRYSYDFTVQLPAQVASNDTGGRHFFILVSAGDAQNGNGKYMPVWVPSKPIPANTTSLDQLTGAKSASTDVLSPKKK
ncbi:MAG: hypothetical protein U0800_21115 [Isosphaeraceae bacterium]